MRLIIRIIILAVVLLSTADLICAQTFGNTNGSGGTNVATSNTGVCTKQTTAASGTTSSTTFSASGTATGFIGAIYADSGGSPSHPTSTTLATSSIISASGVQVPQTATMSYAFTAGTYWLCVQSAGGGGGLAYYDAGAANQSVFFTTTYSAWPDCTTGCANFFSASLQIYVTYTSTSVARTVKILGGRTF